MAETEAVAPAGSALGGGPTVDVSEVIDAAPWSSHQKLVLVLATLALVLDGFDTLALGFAAPALLPDLGVTKAALAPVLAVGLIGMTIGAALGGLIGDRLGRKVALTGSVILFGTMTCAMALADDLVMLGAFRFIAGFGLGGALPNGAALVAEFTPFRRRGIAVTANLIGIPLGGVVGGFVAAAMLESVGWRGLFAIAGALPLVLAVFMLFLLPESPRFLATRSPGSAALRRTLRKMNIVVPDGTRFVERSPVQVSSPGLKGLFAPALVRDTLALWLAFFACLMTVYMSFSWLPTMLSEAGYSLKEASSGLLAFNVGSIVAALVGAWLIGFWGSKIPMIVMAFGGAFGAILLMIFPITPSMPTSWLILAMVYQGACIVGLQILLYLLATNVYPTEVRSTGVGASAGVGRIGAVLSSFIGAAALAAAGDGGFYLVAAVAMVASALGVALVSRHIEPRPS